MLLKTLMGNFRTLGPEAHKKILRNNIKKGRGDYYYFEGVLPNLISRLNTLKNFFSKSKQI